ncbi:unnamed protein product [Knipowitschia caucasica]
MEEEVSLIETGAKEETEDAQKNLHSRVEELIRLNAALSAENDMYEQFISRLDPQELISAQERKSNSGGRRWRSKSQPEQQLSLQQKCYVAQSELMETEREQERSRQKYERIHDSFKDSMKEAEMRLEDIRKEKVDVERRLLKPLRENRLDIHDPEKVLRFIKDKSKINQMEKCSLKTQSLRVQEKKLQQQLRQRTDLGKADHEEFHQHLNEDHSDMDLDEVRADSIKAQHALSSYKEKLQSATSELSNLLKEIKGKEIKAARLEARLQKAEEERLKEQILNGHLERQISEYEAPGTTEYMLMKEKHRKLQQTILTWERRAGVAEMALKFSQSWPRHSATFTPVNSAETRAETRAVNSAETRARTGERNFSLKLPNIAEHKKISLLN